MQNCFMGYVWETTDRGLSGYMVGFLFVCVLVLLGFFSMGEEEGGSEKYNAYASLR